MSIKPHECSEDYSFVREGYRCLFGDRCGRRPSGGVLGGGGSSSHSSYSYNAFPHHQQQEAVLACALMCIQHIIVQTVEAVFEYFVSDSSGVEMGSADPVTTQVESSESSTANIAVDESPVETLANTGVANSDLVADVGDLVAKDESSSIVLPETSEGSK